MELAYNQQYINYSKSGFIYHFYTINKNVYVSTIKNGEIYATVKITENVIDYCVDIDDFDAFHLVSISSSGDLKYCIYKDNNWDCRYLTKYDAKSYQFKNLKLFIVNESIHILMSISNIIHPELWTLKHHYWNKQAWVNKKVCDIVAEKYDLPFYADMDPHHNIHIVYKSLYGNKYQIYYCKYNAVFNIWSIPLNISNSLQDNSHPFILCDQANGAHIAWSGFYNNNLQIFYLDNPKINSSKNYWSEIKRISSEGTNSTHPFIFQTNNEIKIVWKQNDKYIIKSRDMLHDMWIEPEEIQLDDRQKLYPISIIGNIYKSSEKVKIPFSYGRLVNNEFYIIALDNIPSKNINLIDSQSANEEISLPQDQENGPFNHNLEQNSENDEIYDMNNKIQELSNVVECIYKEQKNMIELLNKTNKQLEINGWKIDEFIHLYSNLYDHLKNSNNNFWMKIKNMMK